MVREAVKLSMVQSGQLVQKLNVKNLSICQQKALLMTTTYHCNSVCYQNMANIAQINSYIKNNVINDLIVSVVYSIESVVLKAIKRETENKVQRLMRIYRTYKFRNANEVKEKSIYGCKSI